MKNPDPLEKDIEKRVCAYARERKFLCYKFTSPAQSHIPDRIFITPAGVVFMVEFKRKGKKPTPAQDVEITKIRATGVQVNVVDNVEQGKRLIDTMAIGKGAFVYDLGDY
jgi:hypothetical protein